MGVSEAANSLSIRLQQIAKAKVKVKAATDFAATATAMKKTIVLPKKKDNKEYAYEASYYKYFRYLTLPLYS
jgi:hypothetical protein